MASKGSPQPDLIAWVHLSDFHFTATSDYGRDEVLSALLEDLRGFSGKQAPARGAEPVPLDFIFVSGDIAYSGKPDEYSVAERFLRQVCDATGVPPDRVFLIPGNHDIDRDEHEPMYVREITSRDKLHEYWSIPRRRGRIFKEKLAAYRAFVERFNSQIRVPEEQAGGFAVRVERSGRTVALLGLGSSWLGQGGPEDDRTLLVGKEQIYDLTGGVELPELADADLRVGMVHHPLDWLREFDRHEVAPLLGQNLDVVLRGHLHQTGLEWHGSPDHTLRTIAAGSAYAGSDYRNAYNIVRVAFGRVRHVKIWLRAYAAGGQFFTKDVETYKAVDDGTLEFDLAGEVRKTRVGVSGGPAESGVNLRPYFEKLEADNLYLEIRGMGAKTTEQVELERVYTRLRVVAPPREERKARWPWTTGRKKIRGKVDELAEAKGAGEPAARDRELRDVLPDHDRLALVGDPGSGKTTYLRFVALNLARAHLRKDARAAMARLGLSGAPPFPIFVRLAVFANFLRDHLDASCPDEAPEHFLRYLDFSMEGFGLGLPAGYLRERFTGGGCVVLLDGLDEVPGQSVRERVGRIIEQVVNAGVDRGNRCLVTSRTRAYTGHVELAGFARCHLVDFGPGEIEEFATLWSRALFRVARNEDGTAAAAKAASYAHELREAIQAHPSVGPMTANPLMLTVLAVVHWSRKKLPEQRAELYEAAIEYLLESRATLSPVPNPLRKECLQAIALRMFEDQGGVRKTIARRDAAATVQPLLGASQDAAVAFLEDEELHSGIIVSRMEGEVEFWHLTFQEYLAALRLSYDKAYLARMAPHLYDVSWSEVVLLLAGCRRRQGIQPASEFLTEVLSSVSEVAARARAVGLVHRMLRDIAPYGGNAGEGTGYEESLRQVMEIFSPDGEHVSEDVRVEVGEALGEAGDPRLADPALQRVTIAGGSFRMGTQGTDPTKPGYDKERFDDEGPVRRVTVASFLIDRYPVTVERFKVFVDAREQGYLNPRHWDPAGWAWRQKAAREKPDNWEQQLRHRTRPVTSVSWYEADAFARWSGARLPAEAEWEFAARGVQGRKYPWGDAEPTEHHANFDGRRSEPTPVGIYPLGATPEDVHDLAGNVWEWCADWSGAYTADDLNDPRGPATGSGRVVRGGSFDVDARYLRAAFRYDYGPDDAYDYLGFRCVVGSAGGQI